MNIGFAKMHGSGNDFMLINGTEHTTRLNLDKQLIQQWSDRHTGIGFDQLLIVDHPSVADVDFDYRIFNADGSEVGQCGNGARCVAHFVHSKGLTDKETIRVRSATRIMKITRQNDNHIAVDMGSAEFEPECIPFDPSGLVVVGEQTKKKLYTMNIAGYELRFSALSFGNPHAVIRVNDVAATEVAEIGAALQAHRCFPESVNVSFARVCGSGLQARVYERGVGETKACGSGACAIAVVARLHGWFADTPHTILVHLVGGSLEVRFDKDKVELVGPAELVYEDRIEV
ncbi:MAG: diaminopimelate epimerase [Chromatiales bacterium]|nr:diaminopimelate epimerase [Chromatiales bacterium]